MDEAEGDLKHAISATENGFHNWACFSAQQSAEKAIKAVFQKIGAIAWGHSVADLLKELSKIHPVSDELLDKALELDKSYISARYPDAHPSGSPRSRYTQGEARRLIEYAEGIFQFCSGLLSSIQQTGTDPENQ
jgi:HEPN domain-containing protein